jgi:hypothetical protein
VATQSMTIYFIGEKNIRAQPILTQEEQCRNRVKILLTLNLLIVKILPDLRIKIFYHGIK